MGVIRVYRTAEFEENLSRIFVKDDTRNAEFSRNFMDLRILHLLSCKKGCGHISNFSVQHYENIFQALHNNFNCLSPPLSTWMDIGKEVVEHGTLAKTDGNGGF